MSIQKKPLYQHLSGILSAIENCRKMGNDKWLDNHEDNLSDLLAFLPSGSGIDNEININRDDSTPEKLVFSLSYHHMNDGGYYTHWTGHTVIVTPSLQFDITIDFEGDDDDNIHDYLHDVMNHALIDDVWQNDRGAWVNG